MLSEFPPKFLRLSTKKMKMKNLNSMMGKCFLMAVTFDNFTRILSRTLVSKTMEILLKCRSTENFAGQEVARNSK